MYNLHVHIYMYIYKIRPLGYERVYLPLHKVADTLFHIQENDICDKYVKLVDLHLQMIPMIFIIWSTCTHICKFILAHMTHKPCCSCQSLVKRVSMIYSSVTNCIKSLCYMIFCSEILGAPGDVSYSKNAPQECPDTQRLNTAVS